MKCREVYEGAYSFQERVWLDQSSKVACLNQHWPKTSINPSNATPLRASGLGHTLSDYIEKVSAIKAHIVSSLQQVALCVSEKIIHA